MTDFERIDSLDPEDLGRKLVYAALFVLAAELIGDLVVRPIRTFYDRTTFHGGPFTSYDVDVRSRHKDVFQASLLWLRDLIGALSSQDVMDIQAVRVRRNTLAHELSTEILTLLPAEDEALLARARSALFRLSNHKIIMDIGSDPEFQNRNIDWDTIHGSDFYLLDRVIEKTRNLRGLRE